MMKDPLSLIEDKTLADEVNQVYVVMKWINKQINEWANEGTTELMNAWGNKQKNKD